MPTIFTRIAKGEIPSYKVAENEDFYAFLDIAPLVKGHTLVIPKNVEDDYIFHLDDKTYLGLCAFAKKVAAAVQAAAAGSEDVAAPLSGKFYLTKEPGEQPRKVGDAVKRGETLCYIEAMKINNAVCADFDGVITEIVASNGDTVEEDDVIIRMARK